MTCLHFIIDLRLKWLDFADDSVDDDDDESRPCSIASVVEDEPRPCSIATVVDGDAAAADGDARGDRNSSTFS